MWILDFWDLHEIPIPFPPSHRGYWFFVPLPLTVVIVNGDSSVQLIHLTHENYAFDHMKSFARRLVLKQRQITTRKCSQLSPCGHPAITDTRYYGQNYQDYNRTIPQFVHTKLE